MNSKSPLYKNPSNLPLETSQTVHNFMVNYISHSTGVYIKVSDYHNATYSNQSSLVAAHLWKTHTAPDNNTELNTGMVKLSSMPATSIASETEAANAHTSANA